MVEYKAIADAIPEAEMNVALAELAVEHPLFKKSVTHDTDGKIVLVLDSNGDQVMVPYLDTNGDQKKSTCKFMTDVSIRAAFDKIVDLSETVSKGYAKQSYISLSSKIGMASTVKIELFINNLISAGKLSSWVDSALRGSGLNVNDPQIVGLLNQELLAGNPDIDQALVDEIVGTGSETVRTFQGLKVGQVQTAIQKRFRGEI